MLILRESLAIFKRNPLTSALTLVLIVAASVGQVLSLSSLYPILQTFVTDQNSASVVGPFASVLARLGAAPTFVNFLLLFVVLGVAYSVLNWGAEAFQEAQLTKFESALRQELFEAAVRARWSYGRDLRHGEFLSVMVREVPQYRQLIAHLLRTFGGFLQVAALLAYAFYMNWEVTGLGVLLFSAGGLVLAPMLRRASALGKAGTESVIQMSDRLVAALRSLKMVKALSLETYLVRMMRGSFEKVAFNVRYSSVLASAQYAIMEIVGILAVSSMLYVGLVWLSIPKAELIVILLLLFRALPFVRLAIDNYHRAHAFVPSMQIAREALNGARKAESRRGGIQVAMDWRKIEFTDVGFAYDRVIVRNLSFSIGRGEFWAVLGPSGSGKTTLLDLLGGLLETHSGIVAVDNVPLHEADLESWHAQIAYLGQDAFVFAGTIRENLLWGSDAQWTDEQLRSALRAAKLDAGMLDRQAGENGSNLSGGEKQRLALARLFLRQPGLVILDEPTTGLDAATEKDIFDSISSNFGNATVVIVTHREELVREADHVIRFRGEGVEVEAGIIRGF